MDQFLEGPKISLEAQRNFGPFGGVGGTEIEILGALCVWPWGPVPCGPVCGPVPVGLCPVHVGRLWPVWRGPGRAALGPWPLHARFRPFLAALAHTQ
jgi:hypothetical protein